jgi:glucose-6-phosphate 1-dehydrogenase
MEPPASLDADALRNERVKVLSAIRAQYEGYRSTKGVPADSPAPTLARLKLFIDNWRWKGVPFYLRSGKAMAAKSSAIIVAFQPPPDVMFDLRRNQGVTPNFLAICIQPNEGLHLRVETKVPDKVSESRSVHMSYSYSEGLPGVPLQPYAVGSWGPSVADDLPAREGHAWRMDCCGMPCR